MRDSKRADHEDVLDMALVKSCRYELARPLRDYLVTRPFRKQQ